jgi:hypothetical protein
MQTPGQKASFAQPARCGTLSTLFFYLQALLRVRICVWLERAVQA